MHPDTCLQMRLHSPVEAPKVAEFGYLLSPGEEYRVAIKPMITNASSSLRKIPQDKRQCVFSNEKYLKFYRTYTQRNCAMECEANYTLAMCFCVPYYLPSTFNIPVNFSEYKGFINKRYLSSFTYFFGYSMRYFIVHPIADMSMKLNIAHL